MHLTELFRLFVSSLNMMAIRGYCIENYREFIDQYNEIRDLEKNNENLDDIEEITDAKIAIRIRSIMDGSFNYKINSKSARDNYTYAVRNYTTGHLCLVFFSSGKNPNNFLSDDLQKIVEHLQKFSKENTGESDFCLPNSGIKGVVILRGKIGPNPKEKAKKIQNIDIIPEKNILACPYDNIMQSHHNFMSKEDSEKFYHEVVISKNNFPSISKAKDSYCNYVGTETDIIDKTYRCKFDDRETLDSTLYYRRIKL